MSAVAALRTFLKKKDHSQSEANTLLRRYIATQLESSPHVVGALFYGSGRPESDIDYLVVYHPSHKAEALKLEHGLTEYAQSKDVILDGRWISYEDAVSEEELLSRGLSYYLHLTRATRKGPVIKDSPISLMPFFEGDWTERLTFELKLYLEQQLSVVRIWQEKFKKLEDQTIPKGRSKEKSPSYKAQQPEEALYIFMRNYLYQYLETVLGTPQHVMRKTIELREINLEDDRVEAIQPRYLSLVDPTLRGKTEELIRLKSEYLAVAKRKESVSHKEYADLLHRIERKGSALLEEFLVLNLERMNS